MKKILVVNDDKDILEIIKLVLTINDFDVHTYSTGLDVQEVVKWYSPDLILLDIRLPGKLGTDICKELKQTNIIPIILISSYINDHDESIAQSDADAFVTFPFNIGQLVKTINQYIT